MVVTPLNGDKQEKMDASRGGSVNLILRSLDSWTKSLIDAFPPYHRAEGPLENKETDSSGKYIITVNSASMEVDKATFDSLVIGEILRVRYTRAYRAINIDRLLPGRGPG